MDSAIHIHVFILPQIPLKIILFYNNNQKNSNNSIWFPYPKNWGDLLRERKYQDWLNSFGENS